MMGADNLLGSLFTALLFLTGLPFTGTGIDLENLAVSDYNVSTNSPSLNEGDWLEPEKAYGKGGGQSFALDSGVSHEFSGFGFDIPAKSTINGIEVLDDSWVEGTIFSPKLKVFLSGDGGNSWTNPKSHALTDSEQTHSLGGPEDSWGVDWLSGEINSDDFRVKIESASGLMIAGSSFREDWVRVKVHYTEPVDSYAPDLNLKSPKNKKYGFDEGIPLSYEVSDDVALSRCWYNLDGDENITIKNCENTFFDANKGIHSLNLFAEDTSGKVSTESVKFLVSLKPSQPVLVLYDSSMPSNHYDHYLAEILKTEGLMAFQKADLSDYRKGFFPLNGFDLVILLETTGLNVREVMDLKMFVRRGGSLIGVNPDKRLAKVFGVKPLNSSQNGGYIKVNGSTEIGHGVEETPIQFHSEAELYELEGAEAAAWLYSDRNNATNFPAITQYSYGKGRSVLFAYPLVKSVVLLHQGDDSMQDMTDTDGDGKYRPQDYFANGFYDASNASIPQADEHQSALVNSVYYLMSEKKPLPRAWYFPDYSKVICLISSDSGGDDGGRDIEVEYHSNKVESYGGCAHYNILDLDLSVREHRALTENCHSVSPHAYVSDTPTLEEMEGGVRRDVRDFKEKFGDLGKVQVTHSNIFVGYWETAKYFADNGIRMSAQNGAPIHEAPYHGYLFGTALPFKIIKNEDGNPVINAFQQPLVFSDMVMIEYGGYNEAEAKQITKNILDNLKNSYYGTARFNFHAYGLYIDNGGFERDWFDYTLDYCSRNSMPLWSSDHFYNYWTDRLITEFENIRFNGELLSFRVWAAPNNSTILVPGKFNGLEVKSVEVDGSEVSHSSFPADGTEYTGFTVSGPDHRVKVLYAEIKQEEPPKPGKKTVPKLVSV